MRAVVVDRWMQSNELRVSEITEPNVGPGSLKVEIRAAGCNFFDTLIIQGSYQTKPPFPFTLGGDMAGVICEVGAGVEGFSVGDRVFASTTTGSYAEYSVISAHDAYRLPDEMSFEEGAAFPIVYPTSYAALILRANLREKETLLVHAAAGGVGIAALQIGRALGARIIATVGGTKKLDIARQHGADEVIDYREEDLVARVKELTGDRGADVIFDPVVRLPRSKPIAFS
jgi:NADPH2:quinone reductase